MTKISIHAAREGGDVNNGTRNAIEFISIHAAREGGDPLKVMGELLWLHISIHAAREGGDV